MIEITSGQSVLCIEESTGKIKSLRFNDRLMVKQAAKIGPLRFHAPLPDFEAHMVEAGLTEPEINQPDSGKIIITYDDIKGKRGFLGIGAQIQIKSAGDGGFEFQAVLLLVMLFVVITGNRGLTGTPVATATASF